MKLEFCRQILEKYSNIKFHENPSSGSPVVPCERTDMLFVNTRPRLKRIREYDESNLSCFSNFFVLF